MTDWSVKYDLVARRKQSMASSKQPTIKGRAPKGRGARALGAAVKAPARKSQSPGIRASRADKSALRRDAILAAALEEFSSRAFAAARLAALAHPPRAAKCTIY